MKMMIKVLLVLLSLYVLVGVLMYFFQEKLLFHPSKLSQDYRYQFPQKFEEVFLDAPDGGRINALHFKADNPKGVILYFHGNAGDLARWGALLGDYINYDYDVFVMDYRTFGKSTGILSEQVLFDDAAMCLAYLEKKYQRKDIVVYGRSLGSGIATQLVSENPGFKMLILETPYFSIQDMASSRYPILPVKPLLRYPIRSDQYIQKVNIPIYIFHGTADRVVPYSQGKKLYESISNKQAQMFTIPDGGHNNLADFLIFRDNLAKVLSQ